MINTILFDFDGVLVNSENLHFEAEKTLVERHGGKFTINSFEATIGRSVRDAFKYYKETYYIAEDINALLEEHDSIFLELVDESLVLIEGAKELIERVKSHGLKFAIASSGTKEYIHNALKKFDLYELFKGKITSIEMVKHSKPAPDLFLASAKQIGSNPIDCLVIEDSKNGIEAAHNAGMKSFFLNQNPIDEKKYQTRRINSLRDVTLELLQKL